MVRPGPKGGAYRGSDGAVRRRPEAAASWFYADCPAELAAWAAARLRGQFWTITSEMSPLSAWPGTPCAYLLGAHDPVDQPGVVTFRGPDRPRRATRRTRRRPYTVPGRPRAPGPGSHRGIHRSGYRFAGRFTGAATHARREESWERLVAGLGIAVSLVLAAGCASSAGRWVHRPRLRCPHPVSPRRR